MEETLDTDWIKEFEESDEPYKGFYKEAVEDIMVQLIYINSRNEISFVKRLNDVNLENNVLKKDKLVELLEQNMKRGSIKYKPISLIKYNIDIEPIDISLYENGENFNFLATEGAIGDIVFNDTISLFSCINCLYIILHECPESFKNRTRKSIRIKKLKVGRQTKRA
jgi:hypothetical protein